MFEFKLPDLGEGIHEGELISWHVKEGDVINEDDPLCDMETDKATVTIPSPRAGTVTRLNGKAGDTIHVGEILAVIEETDAGPVDTDESDAEASSTTEEDAGGKKTDSTAGKDLDHDSGEPANGVAPEDTGKATEETVMDGGKPQDVKSGSPSPGTRVAAAPAVRRQAREMGVDIQQVSGTGPGGRVTREDLEKFAADPGSKPVSKAQPLSQTDAGPDTPAEESSRPDAGGIPFLKVGPLPDYEAMGPVEKEPIRSIRKKVAEKTTTSMILIPHVAHMDECDVTEIETARQTFNETHADLGKLTLMSFIIKAVSSLLKTYPEFNASIDTQKMEIIYKKFYHIGFAADTPKGLIVPAVRNADQKTVLAIAEEIRSLAQKGKDGSITAEELTGGTFTVTNVGVIGGTGVVPTINYPETAIMGLGRVQKKPVVRDDDIVIRKILPVTLSFDHRVADGVKAARFMTDFKHMLEDHLMFMTHV